MSAHIIKRITQIRNIHIRRSEDDIVIIVNIKKKVRNPTPTMSVSACLPNYKLLLYK